MIGYVLREHAHEGWVNLVYPAINDEGQPLWPQRYGLKFLENMVYYSDKPFIWSYYKEINGKKKEIIKFLDTKNIINRSLEDIGHKIGIRKIETPKEIKSDKNYEITREIREYNLRDARIVIQLIKKIKEEMKKEGIKRLRLMTINQIAINYPIKKLKEDRKSVV